MRLGMVIKRLENVRDQDRFVVHGFSHADSYRGYYEQLAFAPRDGVTVADMLKVAHAAVGADFTGYKGGTYRMGVDTECWIANHGDTGWELTLELLRLMLREPENAPAQEQPRVDLAAPIPGILRLRDQLELARLERDEARDERDAHARTIAALRTSRAAVAQTAAFAALAERDKATP